MSFSPRLIGHISRHCMTASASLHHVLQQEMLWDIRHRHALLTRFSKSCPSLLFCLSYFWGAKSRSTTGSENLRVSQQSGSPNVDDSHRKSYASLGVHCLFQQHHSNTFPSTVSQMKYLSLHGVIAPITTLQHKRPELRQLHQLPSATMAST